jgi:hypothetical protein
MVGEMARTCSMYRRETNAYDISVEKPKGRRPLGKPRRRWEDNIKLDLAGDRMVWAGLFWLR